MYLRSEVDMRRLTTYEELGVVSQMTLANNGQAFLGLDLRKNENVAEELCASQRATLRLWYNGERREFPYVD